MKILIATKNKGKIREMNDLFSDLKIEFIGLDSLEDVPEVEEDGHTFHENAMKKAMTFFNFSSLQTLAEDSGLEVDYLGGSPGIFSARYAGEDATDEENIKKLLEELKNVPEKERTAKFVSVLCLIFDGKPHFFEGEVKGFILDQPRGESGFGYDPLFVPEGYTETFAELGLSVKNKISHRAMSLKKLKEFLKEKL
ncbi:MAG TPA: XTP/dITP diphosphatase [Nitrospirae bacterium]|nr:dITP/XTP pyrophosphatase [bacterium BMS3Abin08]HDO36716.1 XTP/dITP diphosphatase [Nitrospirota bacterium]HDY70920.1 XTP/dITP diphosphatase [Nitrospirota bacterium]